MNKHTTGYQLHYSWGEYSDHTEQAICIFMDKTLAESVLDSLRDFLRNAPTQPVFDRTKYGFSILESVPKLDFETRQALIDFREQSGLRDKYFENIPEDLKHYIGNFHSFLSAYCQEDAYSIFPIEVFE